MMKLANRIDLRRRGSQAGLIVGAALVAGAAVGQEDSLLEEIIVTAEFREGGLQETPIAITAINADMLEARSQTNLAQITAQAPNVSLRPAGSGFGNALVAFIRGIGQEDFNPSVEPGVGVYVDDVYYATITGNVLDLLDLERVEVLRGPQGTLAGRNAIGGAIKLFTRKPDGSDDINVSITKGTYNRTEIRGAGGMTLVEDRLYARIAGVARTSDGYVTRLDYACANNLPPPGSPGGLPTFAPSFGCELGKEGGQSYTSGRLGLRWLPTDNLEISLAASIVNDDSESQPGVLLAAADHSASNFPWLSPNGPVTPPFASQIPNNPTFDPLASSTAVPVYFDNNRNGTYEAGIDVAYDNRFATGGSFVNYATYINDGLSTPSPLFQGGTPGADTALYKPYVIEPINELKAWDASVNVDWQMSDNVSLLSVSSYRTYDNFFASDNDGSPLAVAQLLQVMNHEQWSQELRLNASLGDGFADLTVGAFYLDQDTAEDARVDLPYVGFDFIHGPDLVPATNQAIYGHVTLYPTDRLDISLGVRYSEDEKSYTFRRRNPDLSPVEPCTTFWFWEADNPANCGVFGLDNLPVAYSSDSTDYRLAISYDVGGGDTMVYGQFASGYKAGGNNARPFFPSQLNAFDPEELDSYELGFKSTFSNRHRFNVAAFWNDYTAIQLPTTVCAWAAPGQTVPCASQNNVGDAEVWGVEIETEWHPGDAATIDFSYSFLDFEYQTIDPGATAVTLGMKAPYTPENKWSLGAQYDFTLPGGGTLTPRIDVSYQDEVFADAVNAPTNLIEDYTLVNARLTWRSLDDVWQIALEGTNLTDEYYYVTLFDSLAAAGYLFGQPGRPSEWAVTVRRSF